MCDEADDAHPTPDTISNKPQIAILLKPCLIQNSFQRSTIYSNLRRLSKMDWLRRLWNTHIPECVVYSQRVKLSNPHWPERRFSLWMTKISACVVVRSEHRCVSSRDPIRGSFLRSDPRPCLKRGWGTRKAKFGIAAA